jgi:hypothetical protein
MVVDSGNKSLHGWFEMNEKITEQQRFFLRQLGADVNTMRPSQPVRLPGAIRDNGNVQSILWLPSPWRKRTSGKHWKPGLVTVVYDDRE